MLKFKYCRRLLLDIINPQKVETPEVQMTGRSLHENKGTIGDHHYLCRDMDIPHGGLYRFRNQVKIGSLYAPVFCFGIRGI